MPITTDSPATEAPSRWQLADWIIEPGRNRLWLEPEQREQVLEPRLMLVLQQLLQAGGQPVTDQQLLSAVWAGQVVSDASIYQAIAQLRKAFGDTQKPYRFIERISGRGYQLLPTPVPLPDSEAAKPSSPKRWLALGVVAAVLSVSVGLAWWLSQPKPEPVATEPAVLSTSSAMESYQLGRWHWQQRQPAELEKAVDAFKQAVKLDPTLAIAKVGLCDAYHFQHIYADRPLEQVLAWCEPLLREALQQQPKLGEALASFALLRLTQGDLDAAEHFLAQALEQSPNHAMAWAWSAQLQRQRGRPQVALEQMRKAADLDPLSGLIKRHLAFTLAATGALGESRAVYREAVLLEPDYTDRPIDEIDMLPLTVDRAIAFIEWTRRYPDRIVPSPNTGGLGASVNLALVWLALGELDKADQVLQSIEANHGQHHYVLFGRAAWWQAKGDTEKALTVAKQRAALQPDNPVFLTPVWALQNQLGQREAVRASILKLFPTFAVAGEEPIDRLPFLAIWLSVANSEERARLQPRLRELLAPATEVDHPSMMLRVLLGEQRAVSEQLRSALQAGHLPFPGNGFLLPEQDPIWQQLDGDLLPLLNANRKRVLAAVTH